MNSMHRSMAFRNFYPGDCRRQIDEMLRGFEVDRELPPLNAVVVPHAGWRFSGAVAARALKTLARFRPEKLLLFSAVHRQHLAKPALFPKGSWETPFGEVEVDEELADEILAGCGDQVVADPLAHSGEHALEVVMPLIRDLLPTTSVVPIMVPPEAPPVPFGARLAEVVENRRVAALASTDFTHYGDAYRFTPAGSGREAHGWMRANDRRLVDRAVGMKAQEIVSEARAHRNACGPGALAAAVSYARTRGTTQGVLLERTDSHEVTSPDAPFEMAVGYAGMVF